MITKLLEYLTKNDGSDLYISSGSDTFIRIDGDMMPIPKSNFGNDKILEMLRSIMTDAQFKSYQENMEMDFSLERDENFRFRVNAFYNLRGSAAVFRTIKSNLRTLEEIGTPKIIHDLCKLSKGIVLIVGPTGSGKSTTLAAMIDYINESFRRHIVTIEDPVEFTFKNKKSLINQREVEMNTKSFASALKSALRESPDIIMVGEMRDPETISLALTAAETGHLVFGTLHTMSAAQTINRIIDTFSEQDRGMARSMLSSSLQAIISQRLLKKQGGGRCAALEIVIANNSIRNMIREDKIPQINSAIEIGHKYGMVTMKQSIKALIENGDISKDVGEQIIESFDLSGSV
jgi:twitching motility protein PilT